MSRKLFTFAVHHNEYGPQEAVVAESQLHALAQVEARYRDHNDWKPRKDLDADSAAVLANIKVSRER